jgi:hypothetical protein
MADEVDQILDDAIRNTETEIFDGAFTPEPAAETPTAEAVTETPKADGRDPATGQFTAKEPAKSDATPEAKAAEATEDDTANVPSWRLKQSTAEKRAAEAERDALKSRLESMERQMAAFQPKAEQPKQEDIDPLLDPIGFRKSMQEGFNAELQKVQLNSNLAIAHVRHGDTFEKAYEALLAEGQRGNRQLVTQLVGSQNPGESIVRWHKNQETLREVGNDPASYKAKVLEDAMKDPEFLSKAMEAARVSAGGQSQGNSTVKLPPSLSRATGSTQNTDPADSDNSEKSVFDYAFK